MIWRESDVIDNLLEMRAETRERIRLEYKRGTASHLYLPDTSIGTEKGVYKLKLGSSTVCFALYLLRAAMYVLYYCCSWYWIAHNT